MDPSEVAALMDKYHKPAILLTLPYPPTTFPHGLRSHFGGLPALSPETAWPHTSTGTPLHFLAQIDCAELPPNNELPRDGTLWFFARIDDNMAWGQGDRLDDCRVIYAPQAGPAPVQAPDDLPAVMGGYARFNRTFVLPGEPAFRVYPRWPVVAMPIPSWPDFTALPRFWERHDDLQEYYQNAVQKERVRALENALGPAAICEARDWGQGKYPGDPVSLPPEADFPQLWVMIDRIARALVGTIAEVSHCRFKETRNKANLVIEQACDWTVKAGNGGFDTFPPDSERSRFMAWLGSLAVEKDRDFRYVLYEALRFAIPSVIQYAGEAPDAAKLIPEKYYRQFQGRHPSDYHQMLGNAASAQIAHPVERDDVLLLHLFSDYGIDFMFCDVGYAEFWISKEDLAAGRFDKVWASTSGG